LKPNKTLQQKSILEAWRPISLLNTVEKIIEAAFAQRITNIAKAKHLLPNKQMGNKRNKSTNLAVRMIVIAATEARKSGGVISLLQLNIKNVAPIGDYYSLLSTTDHLLRTNA
jgi:hypothetical protein